MRLNRSPALVIEDGVDKGFDVQQEIVELLAVENNRFDIVLSGAHNCASNVVEGHAKPLRVMLDNDLAHDLLDWIRCACPRFEINHIEKEQPIFIDAKQHQINLGFQHKEWFLFVKLPVVLPFRGKHLGRAIELTEPKLDIPDHDC